MRVIPLNRSILIFWEQLVFLEAALLAQEDTKDIAAIITPCNPVGISRVTKIGNAALESAAISCG